MVDKYSVLNASKNTGYLSNFPDQVDAVTTKTVVTLAPSALRYLLLVIPAGTAVETVVCVVTLRALVALVRFSDIRSTSD